MRERQRRSVLVRQWARPRKEILEAVSYHWAEHVISGWWRTSAASPLPPRPPLTQRSVGRDAPA